jgi:hypothetical protein
MWTLRGFVCSLEAPASFEGTLPRKAGQRRAKATRKLPGLSGKLLTLNPDD